ncbi:MAG: hypothetical protein GQF41_4549 [Candidatus Rifleibacterium amylolyticum]|nr:MAG: hypothetical protein GQF41_4549 [Candidatus Rifleibacterium amylolyticum]
MFAILNLVKTKNGIKYKISQDKGQTLLKSKMLIKAKLKEIARAKKLIFNSAPHLKPT